MRRILAVAHSYYMLLVLMQMRNTVLKDCKVDLILSDASAGSELVFERLKKTHCFDAYRYLNLGDLTWREDAGLAEKIAIGVKGVFRYEKVFELLDLYPDYDTLLVYVADRFEEQVIFNSLKREHPGATCELYEEGFISYYSKFGILTRAAHYRKRLQGLMTLAGKKNWLISNNIERAWYFEPDLVQYSDSFELSTIPKLDSENAEFVLTANDIFNYTAIDSLKQRFVFLEGPPETSREISEAYSLLCAIADCVGMDEIVVKLHPRSTDNRYAANGFCVMSENVPLELLVLNGAVGNHVFVTVDSGAPLSCMTSSNVNNAILYLFKCISDNGQLTGDARFVEYLASIKKRYPDGRLLVPSSAEELKRMVSAICGS